LNVKALKRARAPIAAISEETWTRSSAPPVILMWSTWALSPTLSSSAVLTWCAAAASWLSTSMTRAPSSITNSERVNTEAGLPPVAANTRWIGRSTVAPLATWISADQCIVVGQRLGHRADREAARQIGKVGQFRHECAVDEHDAPRLDVANERARGPRPRDRGGVRHAGERLGVAHHGAQIGVFPLLDAAVRQVRQAGSVKAAERGLAHRADRFCARQPRLGGRIGVGERELGGGLDLAHFGVHDASAASS
jgi:hypothetical protein